VGLAAHFFFGAHVKVDLDKINAVIAPVVEGQAYELVETEWKHEAGRWVLRVFIDRRAGAADPNVSLDDCANVSRELSAVLDVSDVVPAAYTLEVSSPGLDRPLKKESDFRRFVGHKARIRTRHPVGQGEVARRNFSGRLVAVESGRVRIDVGDQTFDLPVDDVEKANLVYEF
jgi:ribosome maturation factor RimP